MTEDGEGRPPGSRRPPLAAGAPGAADRPYFDTLARRYERYAEITDEIYRPWLAAAIPATGRRERAVDLGCGSGRFTGLLAESYPDVLGVDIAAAEIDIARSRRSRPGVRYEVRDVLDLTPASAGQFDLVFSVAALFHLGDPDRVLPHVRDLVRPGGWAVVVDIVAPSPRRHGLLWHRWWGLADAARTLRRRRSVADAWSVLALRQHPAWMQHARHNRPLVRPEFHRRYAEAFPGAEFTDSIDPFVCALRWQRPEAPAAGG